MKMEVVGTWQPSATATDVTAELSAIDRAGAHIVFTMLSGPVGISVGRQMGERNMKAVAWGINVEGQKEEFWQAAAGKAQFVSTLDTYSEVEMTPKTIPFVRAFKERFKKSPTYTAATYDAIMLLKAVIEQEGTTNADKLVAAHREDRARRHRRDRELGQAPRPQLGGGQDRRHRRAVAGRQEGAVLAAERKGHAAFQDAGALARPLLQDILVTGLVNGGVYALLAIGFSLIFGVARIVNIAHTAFYMLAAYCFYTLLVKTGLGFFLSGVISVGAVTLFSVSATAW